MKSVTYINPPLSSVPVDSDNFFGEDLQCGDILLRVTSDNEFKTYSVASTKTQIVRDGLSALNDEYQRNTELLCALIFWQKRTIDFQALHAAFLMNSISEEEFESEAEKFTVCQYEVSPQFIASIIEKLNELVGIKFDTSDYADFFHCSQQNVLDSLKLLSPRSHFAAMLPSAVTE
jgi:hypothetical protein